MQSSFMSMSALWILYSCSGRSCTGLDTSRTWQCRCHPSPKLQPWRKLHSCSGSAPMHWRLARDQTAVHLRVQAVGAFSVAVHATGSGYIQAGTRPGQQLDLGLLLYPPPKIGSPEGLEHCWRPSVDDQRAGAQHELHD